MGGANQWLRQLAALPNRCAETVVGPSAACPLRMIFNEAALMLGSELGWYRDWRLFAPCILDLGRRVFFCIKISRMNFFKSKGDIIMLTDQQILRIPGPTPIPLSVGRAMAQPMIGHRGEST